MRIFRTNAFGQMTKALDPKRHPKVQTPQGHIAPITSYREPSSCRVLESSPRIRHFLHSSLPPRLAWYPGSITSTLSFSCNLTRSLQTNLLLLLLPLFDLGRSIIRLLLGTIRRRPWRSRRQTTLPIPQRPSDQARRSPPAIIRRRCGRRHPHCFRPRSDKHCWRWRRRRRQACDAWIGEWDVPRRHADETARVRRRAVLPVDEAVADGRLRHVRAGRGNGAGEAGGAGRRSRCCCCCVLRWVRRGRRRRWPTRDAEMLRGVRHWQLHRYGGTGEDAWFTG